MEKIEDSNNHGVGKGEAAWRVSISLLGCVFFCYVFSVIPFYFGFSITEYVFPMAVLAGIVMGASVGDIRMKDRSTGWIAVVLIVIVGSVLASGLVYDHSYDGLRYHQEIVASLMEGWNPLIANNEAPVPVSLWSLHYAKAIEIAEASVGCFTGKIEMGKGVNLIMVMAVAFGVYAFLRENPASRFVKAPEPDSGWSRKKCVWLTIAIVSNPVVISQMITFYIDFYKYLYLIMALLGFYLMSSGKGYRRAVGYIMLGMTLVMAMGTKFNFFFEAGLWMILAYLWVCIKGDFIALKRLFLVSLCALAVGSVLAYHPYITNMLHCGHPLYPLMGAGAVDIMSDNTPDIFQGADRVTNFFVSLISVSFPVYDQRAGGFTIFMPFILLLSLFISFRMASKLKGVVWYIAVCVLLSCFIFEQTWWARYICHLWLFGVIFLVASQCRKDVKRCGTALSILMVCAGIFTFTTSLATEVTRGSYLRYLFESCKEEKVTVCGSLPVQMKRHLDEERVKFIRRDSVPEGKEATALYYYHGCEPVIILNDDQYRNFDEKMSRLHQSLESYRYNPSEGE